MTTLKYWGSVPTMAKGHCGFLSIMITVDGRLLKWYRLIYLFIPKTL